MSTHHNPDVCGWDFDELADLARGWECDPKLIPAAEDLREWFIEQALDIDTLGDGAHFTEADAFKEWGPK